MPSILLYVVPDLLFDGSEGPEAQPEHLGHPDPWKVFVAAPVAKPATHLEKGIVLACRAKEIADGQPFERQSAGQDRAADYDVCLRLSRVVNAIFAAPVLDGKLDGVKYGGEVLEDPINGNFGCIG